MNTTIAPCQPNHFKDAPAVRVTAWLVDVLPGLERRSPAALPQLPTPLPAPAPGYRLTSSSFYEVLQRPGLLRGPCEARAKAIRLWLSERLWSLLPNPQLLLGALARPEAQHLLGCAGAVHWSNVPPLIVGVDAGMASAASGTACKVPNLAAQLAVQQRAVAEVLHHACGDVTGAFEYLWRNLCTAWHLAGVAPGPMAWAALAAAAQRTKRLDLRVAIRAVDVPRLFRPSDPPSNFFMLDPFACIGLQNACHLILQNAANLQTLVIPWPERLTSQEAACLAAALGCCPSLRCLTLVVNSSGPQAECAASFIARSPQVTFRLSSLLLVGATRWSPASSQLRRLFAALQDAAPRLQHLQVDGFMAPLDLASHPAHAALRTLAARLQTVTLDGRAYRGGASRKA